MTINIDVTIQEAKLVTDIIDIWVLGMADAKDLTTEDPTIESAEELLDMMAGYDDDLVALNSFRQKLNPVAPVPKSADEKQAFSRAWEERERNHRD